MDNIWYLDKVNLFNVLCPHKVADYNKENKHEFKTYKSGEVIYFSEDPANMVYLVANGRVRIVDYTEDGNEVVKNILSRGELFGELALLGENKRAEIAEAMDNDTMLCPMSVETMQNLMKEDKAFSFKIYKLIGMRIRKLERRIDSLVHKDVRSRLIEFIKDLAEEKGSSDGDKIRIEHYFTHKNIGNLIGTSRQTVTTLLNELKDEELIDFNRREIIINDISSL